MDILAVVQEHAIESALTVLVVGILQGAVLARGVRNRFPKLKRHTRTVSAVFLILLTISAAINVVKFANPEKYEFVMPDHLQDDAKLLDEDIADLEACLSQRMFTDLQ